MASLRDLGGAAQQLLSLFAEQLEGLSVDLPDVRIVAPGSTLAWDGEMLAVIMSRLEQGQPGAPMPGTQYRATYYVTFSVFLVRSTPALFGDGQPGPAMVPSEEDTTAAGIQFFDDVAALALAATAIHEEFLFTDPGEGFEMSAVTPVGPQGGLVGNQVSISVSVR